MKIYSDAKMTNCHIKKFLEDYFQAQQCGSKA